jgi:hypothetical protein
LRSPPVPEWLKYQHDAAAVFRALGFETEVNAPVKGARAAHAIDVCVRFSQLGLHCMWIIECKHWKTAIPKEKVLALQQVAQDVGADRAILLSETGFQSGAYKAAAKTNVTLASLSDLSDAARDLALQHALTTIASRIHGLDHRLKEYVFEGLPSAGQTPGAAFDSVLELSGAILMLNQDLPKALAGAFPILGTTATLETVNLRDTKAFVAHAERVLAVVEEGLSSRDRIAAIKMAAAGPAVAELAVAVQLLIQVAEAALLTGSGSDDVDPNRTMSIVAMRRVGDAALALREAVLADARSKLGSLMRCLHSTIYLHLATPTVPPMVWRSDCERVLTMLRDVERAVVASSLGQLST